MKQTNTGSTILHSRHQAAGAIRTNYSSIYRAEASKAQLSCLARPPISFTNQSRVHVPFPALALRRALQLCLCTICTELFVRVVSSYNFQENKAVSKNEKVLSEVIVRRHTTCGVGAYGWQWAGAYAPIMSVCAIYAWYIRYNST